MATDESFTYKGVMPNGVEVLVIVFADTGQLMFRDDDGRWGPPVELESLD